MSAEGLVVVKSARGPRETVDRLAAAVSVRGMAIAARIDHAGAAEGVGLALRPTEVLVFGNPRAGTPLMQAAPSIAIDLPLKALVWRDAAGNTWLAYPDPAWLARRHGLDPEAHPTLKAMTQALADVAAEATG
jgi:uncharacterized protein (DUF302 family)